MEHPLMNAPEPALPRFFATPGHPCSYFAEREARTLFLDPAFPANPALYTLLSRAGFRRSGAQIYRPECAPRCRACIPVRIPVARFRARRIHRRVRAANRDLTLRMLPQCFEPAHFALYKRYLSARHAGGGMEEHSPGHYLDFLASPWSNTLFFEYSLRGEVVAVSVIDRLADGLSCVYTFFDPAHGRRSLGTYAILRAIDAARRDSLEWLYLGYYVADSPKMRYKGDYLPQERFIGGRWTEAGEPRADAAPGASRR